MTTVRAAASSTASGMPSSRRHTATTAATFCSVSRKSARTALARSTKRSTASLDCEATSSVASRRREFRHCQARYLAGVFASETEDFTTRRQHSGVRALTHDFIHEGADRIEHVLAIVEDEEEPSNSDRVGDGILGVFTDAVRKLENASDGRHDERFVRQGTEVNQPDAVRKVVECLATCLNGESRLANAARPHERHQPALAERIDDGLDLGVTSDKARQTLGKIRRRILDGLARATLGNGGNDISDGLSIVEWRRRGRGPRQSRGSYGASETDRAALTQAGG